MYLEVFNVLGTFRGLGKQILGIAARDGTNSWSAFTCERIHDVGILILSEAYLAYAR
jgi:hypothetical protein